MQVPSCPRAKRRSGEAEIFLLLSLGDIVTDYENFPDEIFLPIRQIGISAQIFDLHLAAIGTVENNSDQEIIEPSRAVEGTFSKHHGGEVEGLLKLSAPAKPLDFGAMRRCVTHRAQNAGRWRSCLDSAQMTSW